MMMTELAQLAPAHLWNWFAQICAIPHPSYHEAALADHIEQWATKKGFAVKRDDYNNLLIRKPATPGLTNCKTIAVQGHLDMVPQKLDTVAHDFCQDAIQPWIDNEWVRARGTTLGADNGIGVASALALLSDKHLEHGPLEILLTSNEEDGMVGAKNLSHDWLEAEILINTDSETEGTIFAGCAGGSDVAITLELCREAVAEQQRFFNLTLTGLRGGHSGLDIHRGLGNANKLLARFLNANATTLAIQLIDFRGGTLRNAIPCSAHALIAIPEQHAADLNQAVTHYLGMLNSELGAKEQTLVFTVEPTATKRDALTAASQETFLHLLNGMINGVVRYSDTLEDVVETSLNIGIVTMTEAQAEISTMIRAFFDSSRNYIAEMLTSLAKLAGARCVVSRSHPSWQPNFNSPVLNLTCHVYQKLFDKSPCITVIPAGLECGLLKQIYPKLDIVSFGPTIMGAHSADERVDIHSVTRYWQLLTTLIKALTR